MDATATSIAAASPTAPTYRITVIFKGSKSKGTPPHPWRKYGLTFDEAQDIKDEFMTHRINQIINFYMIPE